MTQLKKLSPPPDGSGDFAHTNGINEGHKEKLMREYELTYLVSDDVLEADLKKITDHVAGKVVDGEGKVTKEESWGRRKLAYPIAKQTFATYVTVWFESEAEKITGLEHELRVSPQIIRHLITLKVEKSEVLKVTREDIVGAEEVEKVIGEKSFEVIEGQKEESYDLMSKREPNETAPTPEGVGVPTGSVGKESRDLMSVREKDESTTQTEAQIDSDKEIKETEAEKPVSEKKVKKTKAEKEIAETKEIEPVTEPIKEEKPKKVAKPKKVEKPVEEKSEEDEADRIKKLDEKLDELLKDDL